MTYVIAQTIVDPWRRQLATAGTKVELISDHQGVYIVEDKNGNRLPIRKEKIIVAKLNKRLWRVFPNCQKGP